MTEGELIQAIEVARQPYSYSVWTIGIIDNPERRRSEHGNPGLWKHWRADSEAIARSVEKYFLAKGMKGDTGGGFSPTYVYIF